MTDFNYKRLEDLIESTWRAYRIHVARQRREKMPLVAGRMVELGALRRAHGRLRGKAARRRIFQRTAPRAATAELAARSRAFARLLASRRRGRAAQRAHRRGKSLRHDKNARRTLRHTDRGRRKKGARSGFYERRTARRRAARRAAARMEGARRPPRDRRARGHLLDLRHLGTAEGRRLHARQPHRRP